MDIYDWQTACIDRDITIAVIKEENEKLKEANGKRELVKRQLQAELRAAKHRNHELGKELEQIKQELAFAANCIKETPTAALQLAYLIRELKQGRSHTECRLLEMFAQMAELIKANTEQTFSCQ